MKRSLFVLALLLSATLVASTPLPGRSESSGGSDAKMAQALDTLLQEKDFKNALVGVYVVTLDGGEVVYSHNSDITMLPASNNKVFTTAAAMDILGPDYTYQTTLQRVGKIDDKGILRGHLVAVGSGDPTISGRFNDGDVTQSLRAWVEAVKAAGIKRVEGYVVGDDDLWNDDDYGSGWFWKEIGEWYSAPSGALSFNDNCVDLVWTAGAEVGRPATYTLQPETNYLRFENHVTTRKKRAGSDRSYKRRMYGRDVIITGGIDIDRGPRTDSASVDNPTLYFATVLCELLERGGVEVVKGPADIDDFEDKAGFRKGRTEIASHTSPPLLEIVRVINKRSQNFYADQVLRTLGQQVKGEGGYRTGTRVVKDFLKRNGVSTDGFVMVDGSGLSWMNHTSPRTLVELFRHMKGHQHGAMYEDSLPIGGQAGSLASRFRGSSAQKKVAPRVHAKTGLIGFTRTLSGYVTDDEGRELVFSVMLNNYTAGKPTTWIDRMVTLIATGGKSR